MRSVSGADLRRVMAISSYTKRPKNTTLALADSSTAIPRRTNSRCERARVLHSDECSIPGGSR
jgi:hypothetical protein